MPDSAETPAPAPAVAAPPAAVPDAPPSAKWFEAERFKPHADWLAAKGMTVDDPIDALDKAVKIGTGAETYLGRPADQLMTRPAAGEDPSAWLKSNAAALGLPTTAEAYEIEKPALPDGVAWDGALEAQARTIALEHGIPPKALSAFVGAYAERITALVDGANSDLAAANSAMMTELESQWGQATPAKLAQAQQAAAAIGAKAGIPAEGIQALAASLKPKIGDAGIIRMFAAIGDMMGEDSLAAAPGAPTGGFATTPAEARQKLAAMNAPGSDWYKAAQAGDVAKMKELLPVREALMRVAGAG